MTDHKPHESAFNDFADEYRFWMEHQPVPQPFTELASLINAQSVVLDVGCGDGSLSLQLAQVARHVVGVDISPIMIDHARQRAAQSECTNVDFIIGDIASIGFAEKRFDLIVSLFALHHTDQQKSLPWLSRLLQPGGWFYLQEPVCPVSGKWARHFWYRWQGVRDAPAIARQHGIDAAWRVTRFLESQAWIDHQLEDDFWSPEIAQARYQSLLPGSVVREAPTRAAVSVLWQRPPEASASANAAPLLGFQETKTSAAIQVQRTYAHPKGVPAGYVPFPRAATLGSVVARFEQQVKEHAQRRAVQTTTSSLTYEGLNATANRLARRVHDSTRGTSSPIAILMDQDDSVIPAILGILKAGKAYVVIDPADPPERQAQILSLTGTTVAITTAARVDKLAVGCQLLVAEEIDSEPDQGNLGLALGPDQLAAIFFTSGSTGKPKGIARDHRQFLHSTWLNTNTYYVSPEDRQSLLYFPGFTASVPNIYDTLLNGATLCALNPRHLSPFELFSWLRETGITHFNPPIGLFRSLLDVIPPNTRWADLRLITLGGQPIYGKDVRDFQARFGADTVLLYVLAMTEAGAVTQAYINHKTDASDAPVPAGYALPDKEITILGEDLLPVPAGEVGQIAVTSAYLSLGYWGDEAQTQERYRLVPNDARQRTFLTGDRGRLRTDGCLEFYGRQDFIAKVRGYRVELAAVDAALNSHPAIQSAATVVNKQRDGEEALIGYLVPSRNREIDILELRRFLAKTLPHYMIPARFVLLTKMPLTASGKIDPTKLSLPASTRPDLKTPFVAPRDAYESLLTDLWEEVLGINGIGIHDNFFELGGHSLQAMQIISRVIKAFPVEIPLRILFDAPTVAQMAETIVQHQAKISNEDKLLGLWAELEALPDEEAKQLLAV